MQYQAMLEDLKYDDRILIIGDDSPKEFLRQLLNAIAPDTPWTITAFTFWDDERTVIARDEGRSAKNSVFLALQELDLLMPKYPLLVQIQYGYACYTATVVAKDANDFMRQLRAIQASTVSVVQVNNYCWQQEDGTVEFVEGFDASFNLMKAITS